MQFRLVWLGYGLRAPLQVDSHIVVTVKQLPHYDASEVDRHWIPNISFAITCDAAGQSQCNCSPHYTDGQGGRKKNKNRCCGGGFISWVLENCLQILHAMYKSHIWLKCSQSFILSTECIQLPPLKNFSGSHTSLLLSDSNDHIFKITEILSRMNLLAEPFISKHTK